MSFSQQPHMQPEHQPKQQKHSKKSSKPQPIRLGSPSSVSNNYDNDQFELTIEYDYAQTCTAVNPDIATEINSFSDSDINTNTGQMIIGFIQAFLGIAENNQAINQCILLPYTGRNVLEVITKQSQEQYLQQLEHDLPPMKQVHQPTSPRVHDSSKHHHSKHHHHHHQHKGQKTDSKLSDSAKCSLIATKNELNQNQINFLQQSANNEIQLYTCNDICQKIYKLDENKDDQSCYCWKQDDQIWRVKTFVTDPMLATDHSDNSMLPAGTHYLSTTCNADIKSVTLYKHVLTNNMISNKFKVYPARQTQTNAEKTVGSRSSKVHFLVNHLQDNMNDMDMDHMHSQRHPVYDHDDHNEKNKFYRRKLASKQSSHKNGKKYNSKHSQKLQQQQSKVQSNDAHPKHHAEHHHHHHHHHYDSMSEYQMQRELNDELLKQSPVNIRLQPDLYDNGLSKLLMTANVAHTKGCDNIIAMYLWDMPWCKEVDYNDFIEKSCIAENNNPCELTLNNRWDYHISVENIASTTKQFSIQINNGDNQDMYASSGSGKHHHHPHGANKYDQYDLNHHHQSHDYYGRVFSIVAMFAMIVVLVSGLACLFGLFLKHKRRRTRQRQQQQHINNHVIMESEDEEPDENTMVNIQQIPVVTVQNDKSNVYGSRRIMLPHASINVNPIKQSYQKFKNMIVKPAYNNKLRRNEEPLVTNDNVDAFEGNPHFDYQQMTQENENGQNAQLHQSENEQSPTKLEEADIGFQPPSMMLNETMSAIESDARYESMKTPLAPNSPL